MIHSIKKTPQQTHKGHGIQHMDFRPLDSYLAADKKNRPEGCGAT